MRLTAGPSGWTETILQPLGTGNHYLTFLQARFAESLLELSARPHQDNHTIVQVNATEHFAMACIEPIMSVFYIIGENFLIDCEPRGGLVCRNADQSDGSCKDYRVRFLCPKGSISGSGITCREYCPTSWLDRDDPSGNCDCETLADFSRSQKCQYGNPVGIQCREKNTRLDYQDVGQTMTCNARIGGVCWNAKNVGHRCSDYEVRFICTC